MTAEREVAGRSCLPWGSAKTMKSFVARSWPLRENPWMRQEWEGDLVITDGEKKRVYDVKGWTVTDLPAK